ncbi:type I DNA topoisomerase [Metamycoplasma hominis]|uniref:type I DNA topoisomerase n=1 Tax=Metamycoplasma hominis TaxID=2098 RepID=UPI00158AD263|nr:type I DNA topoisomerase [Metamycoplasma hominis]QKX41014.1 type I DNA topoisomerase [Metamycoplasma hominis]
MENKIMIVESPNKVNTIQKIVGDNIKVLSSIGHILKMSTSGMGGLGIDFENWEPKMVIDPSKRKIVSELKEAAKNASEVLIATDPDREGEAIANNLVNTLKVQDKYKRVKYNEITPDAINYAIENPLTIDENLVNAQKARRILDRIIGFKLSQLIQRKVKNTPTNPSAGRVQSIALKLVVDKEEEIAKFIPTLYSKIEAHTADEQIANFVYRDNLDFVGENEWIKREKVDDILAQLNQNKSLQVIDFKKSIRSEAMVVPFKQSILYKESQYSSATVQIAAQKLFEMGLISYPRTDSTRLSSIFIEKSQKFIAQKYGKEYIATEIKGFSGDQDAHEAIRPTDISLLASEAQQKFNLSNEETNVYKLIYEKTLMALMATPKREIYQYELKNGQYNFKMSYSKIIFDGYYKIFDKKQESIIPNYKVGDIIKVLEFAKLDKETKAPARYNDGSLIKMLDDIKVGRPSTFATTVKIIKDRLFVETKNNSLYPTDYGKLVLEKLIQGFPTTINEEYTASVENQLDLISEGLSDYKILLKDFWNNFNLQLQNVNETMETDFLPQEILQEKCPLCGHDLLYRYTKSKHQKFIGCSNFPSCRYIRNIDNEKPKFFKRRYNK